MAPRKRTRSRGEGLREATALAATLGRDLRSTRRRRRLTQRRLGEAVGLSQTEISRLERGLGARSPLESWIALGLALGRPFAGGFSRDTVPEPADAGHLAAQELVLRLARQAGRTATFELPTRPADPSLSTDVGIRDDEHRVLTLVEIWNRLDELGRAVRASHRKAAEAAHLAAFPQPPYRVATCWLLVDTAANRRIVQRYPELLRSTFQGSSRAWAGALTDGAPPPASPGLC